MAGRVGGGGGGGYRKARSHRHDLISEIISPTTIIFILFYLEYSHVIRNTFSSSRL